MHERCDNCNRLEQKSMLDHEGNCVPCVHIKASDGEVPMSVVLELLNMASSRHPETVEDAQRMRNVLEEEGLIPSR